MKVLRQDETPNPEARKFVVDAQLLETGSLFWQVGEMPEMPVAAAVLAIEGVWSVFLVADVMTVTKDPFADWAVIAPAVTQVLEASEAPVQSPRSPAMPGTGTEEAHPDLEFFKKPESLQYEILNDAIDKYVRPALAADGGGLTLVEILGRIARISYEGACGDCPSAATGTLSFIDYIFRTHVHPDIVVEMV